MTQATALLAVPVPHSQDEALKAPPCAFRVDAHPGESVLESSLSVLSTTELVETRMSQDGEEVPAEAMGDMFRTSSDRLEATWTDRSVEPGADAESAFVRAFGKAVVSSEFEMEIDGGDMGDVEPIETDSETDSLVAGESVVFAGAGDEWVAAPAEDSELKEEDVEGLAGDISLAFLSPDDEVDVGAEWEVPGAALSKILEPLGVLPFDEEDSGGDDEMMGMLDVFQPEAGGATEYKGALKARYVGLSDTDGGSYCELSLTGTLTSLEESTEEVQIAIMGPDGEEEGEPVDQDVRVEGHYEVEGTALFDPVLGQFVRVSIKVKGEVENEIAMSFGDVMGGDMGMETAEVEEVSTVFELSRKALGS